MKTVKPYILTLLTLSIIFSGCWFIRAGMRNIDNVIFDSPAKVQNKIKEPIKDNVKLSALWVGQSTVLLQIDDKVIITDPVFDNVIAGIMMRKVEAGLDISSIPKLDLILVSHAHMDHLSFPTLDKLDKRFPHTTLVIPDGVEKYLPSYNMKIIKMRTGNSEKRNYIGETRIIDGIKITTVYANHQGGRFGLDSYLWDVPGCTGYIIQYKGITVYFAGDTSYDEKAFKELGKKYKIDLALIPMGPCRECDSIGNFRHVASLGALMILDDTRAKYMIPIHFGTIEYFNDPNTPMYVLKDLIKKYNSKTVTGIAASAPYSEKIKILKPGEQYIFEYKN
jgi:N-acyl-phosphatidylethanolamine-hydrolysing phospholipase D